MNSFVMRAGRVSYRRHGSAALPLRDVTSPGHIHIGNKLFIGLFYIYYEATTIYVQV